MAYDGPVGEMLWTPIPDMDGARQLRKDGYANLPVNSEHPLHNDPVVPLANYGIDSQSYWANENSTGLVVPNANPVTTVRRNVAEALVVVQARLLTDEAVLADR